MLLDDDIVVQHDLSPLWDLDLNQKVVGAVVGSWCGPYCCPGRKYKHFFNFTNPIISSNMDENHCGWLYGVNIFNLERWRKSNITAVYHQWLKLVSILMPFGHVRYAFKFILTTHSAFRDIYISIDQ